MRLLVVGDRADPLDDRACGLERCGEHRPVRLVDLAGPELVAGRAQLRARAEHDDGGPPGTEDLGDARRGERADLRGAEQRAGLEQGVARANVATGRPHVRSGPNLVCDLDVVVCYDNLLDRHDRVGSLGHGAAGRDLHRLSRRERPVGRQSGGDPEHDRQAARKIGGTDCEAVHRRARERRQIDARGDILGEHPARRSGDRDALRVERPSPGEHARKGLVDGEQRRHRTHTLTAVISVIVPVHDEERSVALLHDELASALDPLGEPWEVVFVDDGSTDGTFGALTRLHAAHDGVRVVRLRRNFGKAAALQAGFEAAQGEIVVTIDGDLQDDPSEIPRLLAKLDEGFDLVSGWKTKRRDPLSRRIPSRLFNAVTGRLSGLRLHDFNCGLKAYRAEVVRGLRIYGELHRFIPVLAHYRGFRVAELPVNHRPREHGRSRYGMERYVRGFLDLLTVTFMGRYRHRPLHLFGGLGLLLGAVGTLLLVYLTVLKLTGEAIGQRPLLTLGVLLVVVGVQLLSLGLVSELVASHHAERSGGDRSSELHVDEILR